MKLWGRTTIWTTWIPTRGSKIRKRRRLLEETHSTNCTSQLHRYKTICFSCRLFNLTINKSNNSSNKWGPNHLRWISTGWRATSSAKWSRILFKMLCRLDTETGIIFFKFRTAPLRARLKNLSKRKNEKPSWQKQRSVWNSWRNLKSSVNERCFKRWNNSKWNAWRRSLSWSKPTWRN